MANVLIIPEIGSSFLYFTAYSLPFVVAEFLIHLFSPVEPMEAIDFKISPLTAALFPDSCIVAYNILQSLC
jgi:hypothetical protein